jgi:hypothetical protein
MFPNWPFGCCDWQPSVKNRFMNLDIQRTGSTGLNPDSEAQACSPLVVVDGEVDYEVRLMCVFTLTSC